MKFRIIFLVVGLGTFLAGLFLLLERGSKEPQYKGKPISYWLARRGASTDRTPDEALKLYGSNAVPVLLKLIQVKDTAGSDFYAKVYGSTPVAIRKHFPEPVRAEFIRYSALRSLQDLGSQAKAATPSLIEFVQKVDRIRPKRIYVVPTAKGRFRILSEYKIELGAALRALGAIGTNASTALPVLLPNLKDPEAFVRVATASALWKISGTEHADRCVEVLIEAIDDPDNDLRANAVEELAQMGPAAKAAIPKLLDTLALANPELKRECLRALNALGARDQAHRPSLLFSLEDEDNDGFIPDEAARLLKEFGPKAKSAIPQLLKDLHHANPRVRRRIPDVLIRIAPESPEVRQALIEALLDNARCMENSAVLAFYQLGPVSPEIVPALSKFLLSSNVCDVRMPDHVIREFAIQTLGEFGAGASESVPVLIDQLKITHRQVCTAQALGRIGALARPAIPLLVQLLETGDESAKARAAEALLELDPASTNAIPVMGPLLDSTNAWIRSIAVKVLWKTDPRLFLRAADVPAIQAHCRTNEAVMRAYNLRLRVAKAND